MIKRYIFILTFLAFVSCQTKTDIEYVAKCHDKKYCKPILDKVDADIFVMTKLDINERTGHMSSDKWSFSIRIYDVKNDRQINSKIKGKRLSDNGISEMIKQKRHELMEEIKNSANK